MDDKREWVPVEVIWDEDLWQEDPWRGDPRGREARAAVQPRRGPAFGWPQGWSDDDEDLLDEELAEESWDSAKHSRQDGAGLSRRKRKKLRAQDRDQRR